MKSDQASSGDIPTKILKQWNDFSFEALTKCMNKSINPSFPRPTLPVYKVKDSFDKTSHRYFTPAV